MHKLLRTGLLGLVFILSLLLLTSTVFAAQQTARIITDKAAFQQKILQQHQRDVEQQAYNQSHPTGPVQVTRNPSSTDELNTLVTVGTGSLTQVYPLWYWWYTNYTAGIYTAAEIGQAGSITSIAWNAGAALNWTGSEPDAFEIYMIETPSSTISALPTWNSIVTGATLVYSSTSTINVASGWNTYTLTTPFTYSGTNNLMVITRVYNSTDPSSSGSNFASSTTASNQFAYYYWDVTWAGSATTTWTALSTTRPNIQINIGAVGGPLVAFSPNNLSYGSVQANSGTTNRTTYVKNIGAGTLHVSAISGTSVVPSPTSMTIAAGDSALLTVGWTPTTSTTLSENVVVTSDASNGPTTNLPVTGTSWSAHTLPYAQGFTSSTPWPPTDWSIVNDGGDGYTWAWTSPQWATINDYTGATGQIDHLISPVISTTGLGNVELDFNWSYVLYSASNNDMLTLAYTTDNGVTYTNLWQAWATGTGANALVAGTGGSATTPATSNFGIANISLPAGALNQPNVKFAFISTSGYGSYVYVTNFSIFNNSLPRMALHPTTLPFGLRATGSTNTKTMYVLNTGAGTLTPSNVVSSDPTVTPSWTSHAGIAAGDSAAITFTWTPTLSGALAANVTFSSDGSNSPITLPVSGTAQSAVSSLTEPFGAGLPANWTSTTTFTSYGWFANTNGNGGVNGSVYSSLLYSNAPLGATSALFSPVMNTTGISAVPGANMSFDWWFNSTYSQTDTLYLVYSLDGGATVTPFWSRWGTGTGGTAGTDLRTTATGYYYNTPVTTGWASAVASIPAAALGQPSVLFGWVIAHGTTFTYNDSYIGIDNCALINLATPHLVFSLPNNMTPVTNISYGGGAIGIPTQLSYMLHNTGSVAMSVTSVTTNHAALTATFATPHTINPGDSASIRITWTPTVVGAYTDSVTFVHNGDNTPYVVSISGTASSIRTFPFAESFASSTPWPPADWINQYPAGASYYWQYNANGNGAVDGSAYYNMYDATAGEVATMLTPPIDASAATAVAIDFDWWFSSYLTSTDSLQLGYSLDGGTTFTPFWVRYANGTGGPAGTDLRTAYNTNNYYTTPPTTTTEWASASVTVPALARVNGVRFGWRAFNIVQYSGSSLGLDHISIYNSNGPRIAFNPTNLSYANVPAGMPTTRSVYVKNEGVAPLNVSSITATTVSPALANMVVAPNDSILLNVTWTPPSAATLTDNVVFVSNALNGTTRNLPVAGTSLTASMANNTFSPASGEAGSAFAFGVDYSTAVPTVALDSINVWVGGTRYLMAFASGSLPGTVHYTANLNLTALGSLTYYFVATYHDGVNPSTTVNFPYPSGSFAGPTVVPSQTGGPDTYGYRYLTSNATGGPAYNWITPSGAATDRTAAWLGDDNLYSGNTFDGGFSFPFYGTTYTTFGFSDNGFLCFSTTGPSYTGIPNIYGGPEIAFCPGDMYVETATTSGHIGTTNVKTELMTSPTRWVLTITDLNFYSPNVGNTKCNVQVVLSTDGTILINYGSMATNSSYPVVLGIQNNLAASYLAFGVPQSNMAIKFFALGAPTNPNPTNAATSIPTNPVLSWTAGLSATGYNVFLDTANPPVAQVATNQPGTTFTPGVNLTASTLYYWKVVSVSGTNTAAGPVWSFTTGLGASPNAPSDGAFVSATTTSISGSYTDNSTDETSFPLYSSLDGSTFTYVTDLPANPGIGTVNVTIPLLTANTHYWARLFAAGLGGTSTGYAAVNGWTLAIAPNASTFIANGLTFVTLALDATGNPVATEFAIHEINTNQYVQVGGALGASPVWQTMAQWGVNTVVSGLTPGTSYAFAVKAHNGNGDETSYSPATYFTTQTASTLYFEDFSSPVFPPTGWTTSHTDGTGTGNLHPGWTRDTSWVGGIGGRGSESTTGGSAFMNDWDAESGDVDWLMSPAVNTSGAASVHLTYYHCYNDQNASAVDTLEVLYSTDGSTWNSLLLLHGTQLTAGSNVTADYVAADPGTWGFNDITLPVGAISPTLHVAFRSGSAWNSSIWVDNVSILSVGATAPGVPTISISYNKATTTTTLSWLQPAGAVDGYKVYRETTTGLFNKTPARLIATVPGAANTGYTDAGATGREYYLVTAYNAGSSSSSSTLIVGRGTSNTGTSVGNNGIVRGVSVQRKGLTKKISISTHSDGTRK